MEELRDLDREGLEDREGSVGLVGRRGRGAWEDWEGRASSSGTLRT